MVLTVQAAEVAARTGNGETRGARMEVVERLLLHRVDSKRTGLGIDLADEYTVMIPPTPAASRSSVGYPTMMRTEQALHRPVIQSLIILTFFHLFISTTDFSDYSD